jgi:hypothetical protein
LASRATPRRKKPPTRRDCPAEEVALCRSVRHGASLLSLTREPGQTDSEPDQPAPGRSSANQLDRGRSGRNPKPGAAGRLAESPKAASAALPLGGRIKVEPWNDQLTLLKTQAEGGTVAEYEKMPFEVAPFLVYLTRQQNPSAILSKEVAIKAEATADTDHK